jgi:hypothetical protein
MTISFAIRGHKYRSIELLCQGCYGALELLNLFIDGRRVWRCTSCDTVWIYGKAGWMRRCP